MNLNEKQMARAGPSENDRFFADKLNDAEYREWQDAIRYDLRMMLEVESDHSKAQGQ